MRKLYNFADTILDRQLKEITDFYGAWEDLRFPFTQLRQGALAKPDFDETNVGLLFPQNDATEKIFIVAQMPHSYQEGTAIYPHVHWQQSANTAVIWKLDYKWFNGGDAVPASFTTISTSSGLFTYSSGNLHQKTFFDSIDGTGKRISSMLLMKVYRDDNTTTGDVLGFEFDIHYKSNTSGSRSQSSKSDV